MTVVCMHTYKLEMLQNMGQRYVQLNASYTGYYNNTATLHVSQLPPNPAILAPGPAFIFVLVNGVPSIGVPVMVGSGQLGQQNTSPPVDLPLPTIVQNNVAPSSSPSKKKNAGSRVSRNSGDWFSLGGLLVMTFLLTW
jgi:hypothetical protein